MVPDTYTGLFWGYFAFWSLLALYVFSLGIRVKKALKRLESRENK